jgi:HlyD family secretion protein
MKTKTSTAKKRRPLARYGILAIVLAAVAYSIYADSVRPLPVRAAILAEGPIEAYVEERARTSVPRVYHVTMPLAGRIFPVEVSEGDRVEKGQVVARLEDVDWREAAISADELLVAMKNSVAASLAQVKANEARSEFTKWMNERVKKALESNATSEREAREAEWQFLDAQVKEEESIANRFTTEAFYAITKLLPGMVARNLKRTSIVSPVDGIVLKRHVANEKTMISGDQVLDIGNLEELMVTADILTDQAVRIEPGDKVEIYGEAVGVGSLAGAVQRVRPEAFTQLSSLGVEQQRVAVEIDFDPADLETFEAGGRTLGLNYRVRVRVVTDAREKVLVAPRTALFRGDDGGWEVFRISSKGRAERVVVGVGLMNDRSAEIVSGLAAGERLIVAPESGLAEGDRVVAAE